MLRCWAITCLLQAALAVRTREVSDIVAGFQPGIQPGWALICDHGWACSFEADERGLPSSPVLDSLNPDVLSLGYVEAEASPNSWTVRRCKVLPDVDNVVGILKQGCEVESIQITSESLFNIPFLLPYASPDFLVIRKTPVRDLLGLLHFLDDSFSHDVPLLDSALRPADAESEERGIGPLAARANALKAWLFVQAALPGHEDQEGLGCVNRFRGIVEGRLKEALEKVEVTSIAFIKMQHELASSAESAVQCGGVAHSADSERFRSELDEAQSKHRTAESAHLTQIAYNVFMVIFNGLIVAAEFGMPGLGSIVHIVRKIGEAAFSAAHAFENPVLTDVFLEMHRALSGIPDLHVPGLTDSPAQGHSPSRLDMAGTSAAEAGAEAAGGEAVTDYMFTVKKIMDIMMRALIAGFASAVWAAAEFIPVIGPFMSLARYVSQLVAETHTAHSEHVKYLEAKDPSLRTLFRLRDCALENLLKSEAVAVAADESKLLSVREASLSVAVNAARSAVAINDDLEIRIHKTTWILGSEDAHEDKVMRRLQTGETSWYVGSRVSLPLGDSWLSPDVVKPSQWQSEFGSTIKETLEQVSILFIVVPEPPTW